MNPARMRFAEVADAPSIARLVNDAFRPERVFIEAERTNPRKVTALLEKRKFLLLFEEDVLAGCVYAELRGESAVTSGYWQSIQNASVLASVHD